LGDTALSLLELAVGIPLMLLLAFGVGFLLFAAVGSVVVGTVGGVLFALFSVRLVWCDAISRLRFDVIFHEDHVQLGAGLARLLIPCDELEMFGFTREARADCVGVMWRGQQSLIYLPKTSVVPCLQALRERCVNAIYVDARGEEHLPPHPNRPDLSLQTLYRHCRRFARTSAAAVAVSVPLGLYFAAGVGVCVLEKATRDQMLSYAAALAGTVVAIPVSLRAYIKSSRKSDLLSESLAKLQDKSVSADPPGLDR
jgi:hypothetical protein